MILGIMQPYFLPYLGYWQLLNVVDKFIILDDVTFIKKGYINRNTILAQGKEHRINIQINVISRNKLICDHELNSDPKWKKKLLSTISQNYSKSPFYNVVFPIIEKCILYENENLSYYLLYQLKEISIYLDIKTEIVLSSSLNIGTNSFGQNRIIEICKSQSATRYINAIGGKELYDKQEFVNNGLDLKFIEMLSVNYPQFSNDFIPFLSIIDVLMFNNIKEVQKMLNKFTLI